MSDYGSIILRWWSVALNRDIPRGRALSARLRRASPVQALCEPEVHDLARQLKIQKAEVLIRLVTLLAEIREHTKQPLPRLFGGSDPKLSHLRFQRLLRAEGDDLTNSLRRAIRIADHQANVAALGEDLMLWDERIRQRWCFQYFGSEPPKPKSQDQEEN